MLEGLGSFDRRIEAFNIMSRYSEFLVTVGTHFLWGSKKAFGGIVSMKGGGGARPTPPGGVKGVGMEGRREESN